MPESSRPNPNTWDQLESLFARALELPASERQSFVAQACADDINLRHELLRLLESQEAAGGFLDPPTLDFRGKVFGNYELIEEIGRGGMSVVYRARRHDGDFEKFVAIKILLLQPDQRLIASETQILAKLEHPNIARLLDSGSQSGFRYLVMEYIEGTPYPVYSVKLTEEQKLRLFLDLCAAVQYSHQNLIVHRDLKPANILITPAGQPKLLDFGIAKLLRPEDAAGQTRGIRAYTPDYASPEQILGQPVTTASDIYSLGIILSELLSGKIPRTLSTLSVEELVNTIKQDTYVPLPFSGDLAAIAQKAMHRNPSERYSSASELAADVQRYLRQEPVLAQAPSWSYRATKFLRRNALAVGASTVALVALAATAGIAVWQAREATKRFEQVRRLSNSLLYEIHDSIQAIPGSLQATKLITDRSLEYLDALSADPRADSTLQADLVRGYVRLSAITGRDVGDKSLGDSASAEKLCRKAVDLGRRAYASNSSSVPVRAALVEALVSLGQVRTLRGADKEALPIFQEAASLAAPLAAQQPNDIEQLELHANALKQMASVKFVLTDPDGGLADLRQALELRKRIFDLAPGKKQPIQRLAEIHQDIAGRLYRLKKYPDSLTHAQESYRLQKIRYQNNPATARAGVAASLGQLATLTMQQKKFEEAIPMFQEMVTLRTESANADPTDKNGQVRLATAIDRLGNAYSTAGKFPEAVRELDTAVAMLRKARKEDPANKSWLIEYLYAISDLAETHVRAKAMPKACPLLREFMKEVSGTSEGESGRMVAPKKRVEKHLENCR